MLLLWTSKKKRQHNTHGNACERHTYRSETSGKLTEGKNYDADDTNVAHSHTPACVVLRVD